MKSILFRFTIFVSLWAVLLYRANGDRSNISVLLLLFAVSLTLYFFLPIAKKPLILYTIVNLLLVITVFGTNTPAWSTLLITFISIEAAYGLPVYHFRINIASTVLLVIAMYLVVKIDIAYILLFLFFAVSALLLNQFIHERKEQKELYAKLLGEFRLVKRSILQQENVVRLEERTRIAREIHDSVGHKLTALLMQLEIESITGNVNNYDKLKELARESLEETRYAVKELRNEEVFGLQSVLQLIRKLESESHLLVRFTTEKGVLSTPLSNEQSVSLYRAIQEALTNTMKHASSKEVTVTLGRSAIGDFQFTIVNKIIGSAQIEPGFGLTNMKARIEEISGNLRFYRTENDFNIEGSFPLKEKIK